MNRNHAVLLIIALLSFLLILVFIPDSTPDSISSLEGVTLSNLNGQQFRLAGQFTEKPMLIVFWSVTCGTCIEEIPFIIRLNESLQGKLTIIGIHPPGFPIKKIQKFVKKFPQPIPYLIAIDDQSSLIRNYNVSVLPRTLLLNRQGRVLYDHLGYSPENEQEIESAINAQL
ncbi:MAG TPA: TlpA disulfide reductase family protein [Candidatus Rifleibacterium sp.]|nr:TlpA disulfide reductase family protein [Candidatus Rifleibacterium sp.]HPT45322.1 TlpA disulfide reductase family protein [Candidatus Rifleibacterium sp.]